MYYLLYLSKPNGLLDDGDYIQILLNAHEKNVKYGITGMLLATDAYFMQLLEGPKDKVRQLYKHIAKDKRHFDLFIMDEGEADRRYFSDWAMGFDYMNWLGNRNPSGLSPVLKSPEWNWTEEELKHRPIYLLNQFREQFRRKDE
ncbi:MAG: BLUF domain-containing protein [Acidobacteriota bacterium]|nr:BLUF domain-containing protein [Acidobacteriota bacterium]